MLGLTPFRQLPRPVQAILALNLAVFCIAALLSVARAYGAMGLMVELMLIPSHYLEAWRFVTYAFVHVQPTHFLFNMLFLWMFGDDVATWLGGRSFWLLYLLSAVIAGAVSVPFYMFQLLEPDVQILGASGALYGVMVAYGFLFPERRMLFFFVIPLQVRTAIALFIGLDLALTYSGDGVAHFTHLGGALAGFLFMWLRLHAPSRMLWNLRKRKYQQQGVRNAPEVEIGYFDEQRQLDAVLQKISRTGLGSLTVDENRFLQEAAEKRRLRKGQT